MIATIAAAALLNLLTFGNLTLAQAQDAGVLRSPDVLTARATVAEQQALFAQAKAAYGPALTADYAQGPQGGANDTTITQRLTTVGGQITLGDLIAYAPAVAQANARLTAATFDLSNAERTERINVTKLYFAALQAYATEQVQVQALAQARTEERAAQTRFSAGDAPHVDVTRATVAVAKAQADLATAEADRENAFGTLASEVGVMPVLSTPNTAAAAPADDATVPSPDAAIAAALSHRPEIVSAQQNVAAEEHAVAVARRGLFPAVTLNAGYASGVDSGIPVSGPSAGVHLSFPVGGAAHDRTAAEEARLAQAQAQLEKVRRTIEVEVASAVRTYAAQITAYGAAQHAVTEAANELDATELGYRSGASSSLDVDTARATYVSAISSAIAARYAGAQSQATLHLLMGT